MSLRWGAFPSKCIVAGVSLRAVTVESIEDKTLLASWSALNEGHTREQDRMDGRSSYSLRAGTVSIRPPGESPIRPLSSKPEDPRVRCRLHAQPWAGPENLVGGTQPMPRHVRLSPTRLRST